jgi:hypothetical protein
MLDVLADLPANVIGFEVTGKLTAEDFRDIMLPALDKASDDEIRIVIVIPSYRGVTGGALWQDLKIGVEHWRAWTRIAVVTDAGWMRHCTEWFGWMTPGEVKHFPVAQRAEAVAWAAG